MINISFESLLDGVTVESFISSKKFLVIALMFPENMNEMDCVLRTCYLRLANGNLAPIV